MASTEKIGERIREFRVREKLSLDQLARKAGVSKAYISQLENGTSNKPSAEVLYDIALALDTTAAHLLGRILVRPQGDTSVEIPKNLQKIAKMHGIDSKSLQRLASIQRRDGKNVHDYSEEQWLQYWLMMKSFDEKR